MARQAHRNVVGFVRCVVFLTNVTARWGHRWTTAYWQLHGCSGSVGARVLETQCTKLASVERRSPLVAFSLTFHVRWMLEVSGNKFCVVELGGRVHEETESVLFVESLLIFLGLQLRAPCWFGVREAMDVLIFASLCFSSVARGKRFEFHTRMGGASFTQGWEVRVSHKDGQTG